MQAPAKDIRLYLFHSAVHIFHKLEFQIIVCLLSAYGFHAPLRPFVQIRKIRVRLISIINLCNVRNPAVRKKLPSAWGVLFVWGVPPVWEEPLSAWEPLLFAWEELPVSGCGVSVLGGI